MPIKRRKLNSTLGQLTISKVTLVIKLSVKTIKANTANGP